MLRGAGLGGLGYGASQALTLGIYIVLARLITPEEFGDFAAATVLIGFTLLVTETGMMSAIVQRRSRVDEAANTAFLATLVSGVVFTGILFALAPLVGNFFDSDEVQELAAATSGLILLRTVVAVPDGILWRQFSFLRRLVIEPAQAFAFGVAAILRRHLRPGRGVARRRRVRESRRRGVPRLDAGALAPAPESRLLRHVARIGGLRASRLSRDDDPARGRAVGRGHHRADPRSGGSGTVPLRLSRRLHPLPADPGRSLVLHLPGLRANRARRRPYEFGLPPLPSLDDGRRRSAGLFLVALGLQLTVLVFGDVWRPAGYAAMAMAGFAVGGAVTSLVSELLRSQERPAALTPMHATTAIATIVSMALSAEISLTAAAAGLTIGPLVGAAYGLRVAHRSRTSVWDGCWMRSCARWLPLR